MSLVPTASFTEPARFEPAVVTVTGRRFPWWALLLAAAAGYVLGDLLND